MAKTTKAQFLKQAEELIASLRSRIREGAAGKPFDDVSPAACAERRRRAYEDREFFARTYLPHYCPDPTPPFHLEIDANDDIRNRLVVTAAPRGFSKTTRALIMPSLHDTLFQTCRFTVVSSDTWDQAALFTLAVKVELEENERIRCDFGEQRGSRWKDGDFVTANGVRIKARGVGQRIRGLTYRGQRPDCFRGDDLEDEISASSPDQVEKRLRWLRRAVIPGLVPSGAKIRVYGTILHPRSMLARLLDEQDSRGRPKHVTKIYRAITNGKSIWPERFPLKRLREIEEQIGTPAFEAEYQNNPVDPSALFQEEWLRDCEYRRSTIEVSELLIVRAVDPALGQKNSDDTAIITDGFSSATGRHHMIEPHLRRLSILDTVRKIIAMQAVLPARVILIESNGFQVIIPILTELQAPTLPIVRVVHHTQKPLRLATLSTLVQNGKILIDPTDGDGRKLLDQYLYYPRGADDGLDATEMCVEWITHASGGVEYVSVRKRGFEDAMRGWL